jgi:outer membrane protein assembly factor BamD
VILATRRLPHFLILTILLAAIVGCSNPKTLTNLPAGELFKQGKEKYDKKKYLSAIEYFQAIVYNFPGKSIVDTAQYFLALSYYANKEYPVAAVEFNRLLTNYPASVYAAQSQFMKAVCAFESAPKSPGLDQTELLDAIKQFEDFVVDRPESELVPDAQKYLLAAQTRMADKYYRAAVVYSRIHAPGAAIIYYQKVIDDYTNTKYAPLATFHIAEEEYNMNHFDVARAKFEAFEKAFPKDELVPKAAEMAACSAFKSGELAYDKSDWRTARDRFEAFKKDFPDDKRVKKADDYLANIARLPDSETAPVSHDSTNVKTGS